MSDTLSICMWMKVLNVHVVSLSVTINEWFQRQDVFCMPVKVGQKIDISYISIRLLEHKDSDDYFS